MAKPYQLPIRNSPAARAAIVILALTVTVNVELLRRHVLLLKSLLQPSQCAVFHPRPSSCLCTSFPPIYPEIFVVGPGVQAILSCTS